MRNLIILLFLTLLINASAQDKLTPLSRQGAQQQPAALAQLMTDAEIALAFTNISVTDNAPVPPGGSKHDFYSWLPYLWPDPATSDGYPYINKDGQTNPETEGKSDKPLLRKMAVAVQTLALAYHFTGDKKYADKSASLLRTWFLDTATRMNPNFNFAQCRPGVEKGTSTGIIDSRWFVLVIDATGLLKTSGSFTNADENALRKWFQEYLTWLLKSPQGMDEDKKNNNHGTWFAAQTAYFAWFTGDQALARKIVTGSKHCFDTQIDSAGRQTFELTRTKSYDYSLYNVHALITLARIGDRLGVDLWHYNVGKGNPRNLLESIRYLGSFAGPGTKWPHPQIAEKAISLGMEDGDHFSVYYPYDMYSALRLGVRVYQDAGLAKMLKDLDSEAIRVNRANLLVEAER